MTLKKAICPSIESDFAKLDALIKQSLQSDVLLVNQVGQYIISSGGKRLRPQICLLIAKALNYEGSHHITLAAVIELIHTATLLHDDVVDESSLRRGEPTANAEWGNATSVLVGDFLYSKSFQLMVEVRNLKVMGLLAKTTNSISEGEVMQLMSIGNADITEEEYFELIYRKTASLFETSANLAVFLTEVDNEVEKKMGLYGRNLGVVFQIIDDILDFTGDEKYLGKSLGDDLVEGKVTLPMIYALQSADEADKNTLIKIIGAPERSDLDKVQRIFSKYQAIDKARNCAKKKVEQAISTLDCLCESRSKQSLIDLANNSIHRLY